MLSHDTLHSKRVIKIQDLIKHYDSLLASGHEPEIHEAWWSPILTPSSLITHLSISSKLQSYCDLICHHELYVKYRTSIITHHQLFFLFEQRDICT
ncbi:unnamed protein product [Rotaria sp. Silwood1]|nr:unnamed protein product [Rotaria sp. Silwood1]CAF1411908.1 unnamed protein product [Rotaria sp. Silwood1]CAF1414838.1 unnamed protein product [Rotaria sp. Silwood1]